MELVQKYPAERPRELFSCKIIILLFRFQEHLSWIEIKLDVIADTSNKERPKYFSSVTSNDITVAGLQLENFVLPERELDFSCTVT
jgi:hypothetical protein